MSLPENELSSVPMPSDFTGAAALPSTRAIAYRDGGLALQDPSQGITGQVWRARILDNDKILLSAPNYPEEVLRTGTSITDVDIAFDNNMNLYHTWIDLGVCYLHWHDAVTGQMVTTNLGSDIVTPCLDMDDKREFNSAGNDVVLAYIRDGKLYHRLQRDRFGVEHLLDPGPWVGLARIGMGSGLRMQFQVIPFEAEDE